MVSEMCQKSKVSLKTFATHTLFDPEMLFEKNDKIVPETYTGFLGILNKNGLKPDRPIDTFKGYEKLKLPEELQSDKVTEVGDLEFYAKTPKISDFSAYNGHIPSSFLKGGSTNALLLMEKYMKNINKVASFRKPMTNPTSLKPDTTALSPYLKFGCLSSRTLFWRIQDVYDQIKNHTKPPESLHGQIFFREFFYLVASKSVNFDKMLGNPRCK